MERLRRFLGFSAIVLALCFGTSAFADTYNGAYTCPEQRVYTHCKSGYYLMGFNEDKICANKDDPAWNDYVWFCDKAASWGFGPNGVGNHCEQCPEHSTSEQVEVTVESNGTTEVQVQDAEKRIVGGVTYTSSTSCVCEPGYLADHGAYVTYDTNGAAVWHYGNENHNIRSTVLMDDYYEWHGAKCRPVEINLATPSNNSIDYGAIQLYPSYNDGVYLDSNHTRKMTRTSNCIQKPVSSGYTFAGYYSNPSSDDTRVYQVEKTTKCYSVNGGTSGACDNEKVIVTHKDTDDTDMVMYIDADGCITPDGIAAAKSAVADLTWYPVFIPYSGIALDRTVYYINDADEVKTLTNNTGSAKIYIKSAKPYVDSTLSKEMTESANPVTIPTPKNIGTSNTRAIFNGYYATPTTPDTEYGTGVYEPKCPNGYTLSAKKTCKNSDTGDSVQVEWNASCDKANGYYLDPQKECTSTSNPSQTTAYTQCVEIKARTKTVAEGFALGDKLIDANGYITDAGLEIIQNDNTADYAGMPCSSYNTGLHQWFAGYDIDGEYYCSMVQFESNYTNDNGVSGSNTPLYKHKKVSSGVTFPGKYGYWYTDAHCTSGNEVTDLQQSAPTKANATFMGYYELNNNTQSLDGAMTQATLESKYTQRVEADGALDTDWEVWGDDTLYAVYECGAGYRGYNGTQQYTTTAACELNTYDINLATTCNAESVNNNACYESFGNVTFDKNGIYQLMFDPMTTTVQMTPERNPLTTIPTLSGLVFLGFYDQPNIDTCTNVCDGEMVAYPEPMVGTYCPTTSHQVCTVSGAPTGTRYTDDRGFVTQEAINAAKAANTELTWYANWGVADYTVEYAANGGNGYMAPSYHTANMEKALSKNTFTSETKVFTGWNTASDGSGTSYTDEQLVTLSGSVTLYAQWGDCTPCADDPSVECTLVTQEDNHCKYSTKCATGYYDLKNANTANASCKPANIRIMYISGTVGSTDDPYQTDYEDLTYADSIVAKESTFVRNGHRFKGWTTERNDTTVEFNPGDSLDSLKERITQVYTGNIQFQLYAVWGESDDWSITYVLNGGTNPTGAPTSYPKNSSTATALPTPTRDEHAVFGGWYDNKNFDGTAITSIPAGTSGDKTLYAKWTCEDGYGDWQNTCEKIYTLTYTCGDGTGTPPEQKTLWDHENYNTGNTTPINPGTCHKDGYTFKRWRVAGTALTIAPGNSVSVSEFGYQNLTLDAEYDNSDINHSCAANTYWDETTGNCESCPDGYTSLTGSTNKSDCTTTCTETCTTPETWGNATSCKYETRQISGEKSWGSDICVLNESSTYCRPTTCTCNPGFEFNDSNKTCDRSMYLITLDNATNGGLGSVSTIYARYGDGAYLDDARQNSMTRTTNPITPLPTKAGNLFTGYYSGSTYGTNQYINGAGYITLDGINQSQQYTEDVTWFAQFSPCTCTPGQGVDTCTLNSVAADNHCVFNVTYQSGYTGSATQESEIGNPNYTATANQIAIITINLNDNGGTGGTGAIYASDGNVYFVQTPSLAQQMTSAENPVAKPSKNTDLFKGYYSATTGDTQYIDANGYITTFGINAAATYTSNQTWYAQWSADPNAITCEHGQYYNGSEHTCQRCPVGSWCSGGVASTTSSNDDFKHACVAPGTSNVGAGAESDCFSTLPYFTSHGSGTQICYYDTETGQYAVNCGQYHITACNDGYHLANSNDTDCTQDGTGGEEPISAPRLSKTLSSVTYPAKQDSFTVTCPENGNATATTNETFFTIGTVTNTVNNGVITYTVPLTYNTAGFVENAITVTCGATANYAASTASVTAMASNRILNVYKNGGTGTCAGASGTEPGEIICTYGGTCTLPECSLTKSGNYFAGWYFGNPGDAWDASNVIAGSTIQDAQLLYYPTKGIMAYWIGCDSCVVGTGVSSCTASIINNMCTYTATCSDGYSNPTCSGKTCSCAQTTIDSCTCTLGTNVASCTAQDMGNSSRCTYNFTCNPGYTPDASHLYTGNSVGRFVGAIGELQSTSPDCEPASYYIDLRNYNNTGSHTPTFIRQTYNTGWSMFDDNAQFVTITSVPVPTRDGYTFRGYYTTPQADLTTSGGSGTRIITAAGALPSNPTVFTDDGELYAAWAKNCTTPQHGTCNLTVNSDGTVTYTATCEGAYNAVGGSTATPYCTVDTCNNDEEYINGRCRSCNRANATEYATTGNCIISQCTTGYHPSANGGECVDDVQECTPSDTHAMSGQHTWNHSTNEFDACIITACSGNYHVKGTTDTHISGDIGTACVANERNCTVANGSGIQEWNTRTNKWGACVASSCNPGYTDDTSEKITADRNLPCGRCYNMYNYDYNQSGEIAVSTYAQGCQIASCMYQGEKYALIDNECQPICAPGHTQSNQYVDIFGSGSMYWNNSTHKCIRTCADGYEQW